MSLLKLPLGSDSDQLDLAFHADLEKNVHLMPPDSLHGDLSRPGDFLDGLPLDQGLQDLALGRCEQLYAVAETDAPAGDLVLLFLGDEFFDVIQQCFVVDRFFQKIDCSSAEGAVHIGTSP